MSVGVRWLVCVLVTAAVIALIGLARGADRSPDVVDTEAITGTAAAATTDV